VSVDGKPGVLFLCVANSARSQMAEGLARQRFGDRLHIMSAGTQPARMSAYAVEAMKEIGIDIRRQCPEPVNGIDPDSVDLVITLCAEEICPVFLKSRRRLRWPQEDPVKATGSHDEILERFRAVRDSIAKKLDQLETIFPRQ